MASSLSCPDALREHSLENEAARVATAGRPRIAIVSTGVPPSANGQSRVLGQLLEEDGTAPYCLLLSEHPPELASERDKPYGIYRRLRGPQLALWEPERVPWLLPVNEFCGFLLSTSRRAREIAREVRAFGANVIVACTASPFDIPASALAAIVTRLPLIVYLFDDPVFQWEARPLRRFARLWEPVWSRLASATIAPNELMAQYFHMRTGKQSVIIRNPVSDAALEIASNVPEVTFLSGQVSIVYTGKVYHAQADAFRNLIQALNLQDGRFVLDIYTSQTRAEVAGHGVDGRYVRIHDHLDQLTAYAIQRNAGILFLPLAFKSGIQEVIRTSAPAKLGEYLASGRPVLVHAPGDTFVASFVRENKAGLVVDTADPMQLSVALERITSDAAGTLSLVRSAKRLSRLFSASMARRAFWDLMILASEPPRQHRNTGSTEE
jgi:glycosyltransferase involved in cell wall biosynthesis